MIIKIDRLPTVVPPIRSVTLELTAKEWHDLRKLLDQPSEVLLGLWKTSNYHEKGVYGGNQTYDVIGLRDNLFVDGPR